MIRLRLIKKRQRYQNSALISALAAPKTSMNAIMATDYFNFWNFAMIENLNPQQAWDFQEQNPHAFLIDVRTQMEYLFVGHPPQAIHIPWKEMPTWLVNSNFVEHTNQVVQDLNVPILLLCRSGQRSLEAAMALENAGYSHLINIADGFEGSLDQNNQRGNLNGWRFAGLPWQQN